MSHDIFISYSSKDKQTADAICHVLESNKLKCWIAPRNIIAGRNYAEQIMTGLKTAKVVVLVFSKNAQESVFVNNEIDTAFSNNKPIISFKIDETFPEKKMEFFLKNKHWLDAYPNPESVFETLVRDAYLLCEDEPEEYVEPKEEDIEVVKENYSELEEKLDNTDKSIVEVVELDEYPKEVEEPPEESLEDPVPESPPKLNTQISTQEESDSSGSKLPIIAVIAVILIAVIGFVVFSGGMGGDSSSSSDGGIVIDFVELDDDSDKGYSWKYSYFVMGSISPDLTNSSKAVVHTDYLDSSGDIVKSNETKLKDIDGNVLGMCFVNEKVAKVSVELRDSDGKVISTAESEDIQ